MYGLFLSYILTLNEHMKLPSRWKKNSADRELNTITTTLFIKH